MFIFRFSGLASVFVMFCLAVLAGGCIWPTGPGGMSPGLIANNTAYPNRAPLDTVKEIEFEPGDLEFVGWVKTASRSANMTGRIPGPYQSMVGVEDNDYASAFELLRETHVLDGLLNKTVDTRRWQLNFFFVRFSVNHTVIGGYGFRYRRPIESLLARAVQPR